MNKIYSNTLEHDEMQIIERLNFYRTLLANMKVQQYLWKNSIDEIENKERILMYKRVIRKLDIKLIKIQEIMK